MGRRFLRGAAVRRHREAPRATPAGGWRWRGAAMNVAVAAALCAGLAWAGLPVKGDAAGTVLLDPELGAPERYKAELDPPGLELSEFTRGPLMGWYVYVYVKEERVVCANPRVWDGPRVITCTHVVAIDEATKPGQAPPAGGPYAEAVRAGRHAQNREDWQR